MADQRSGYGSGKDEVAMEDASTFWSEEKKMQVQLYLKSALDLSTDLPKLPFGEYATQILMLVRDSIPGLLELFGKDRTAAVAQLKSLVDRLDALYNWMMTTHEKGAHQGNAYAGGIIYNIQRALRTAQGN